MGKTVNVTFKNTERDKLVKAEIEKYSDKAGYLKDLVWEKVQQQSARTVSLISHNEDCDDEDIIINLID